jgi:hypothetical protein
MLTVAEQPCMRHADRLIGWFVVVCRSPLAHAAHLAGTTLGLAFAYARRQAWIA